MSDWLYYLGIDYARGGVRGTADPALAMGKTHRSGDDFACAITRAKIGSPIIQLVGMVRHTGITTGHASAIIHKLNISFRFTKMMMDPGAALNLRDDLRNVTQTIGSEKFQVVPLITEDDSLLAGIGSPVLSLFRRGDPFLDRLGIVWQSESSLPNKMHDTMKTLLELRNFQAPARWSGWDVEGVLGDPKRMRNYLNAYQGLSEADRSRAECNLAMVELFHVDPDRDEAGNPILDKSQNMRFDTSKGRKKDSAYAVCYSAFCAWVWQRIDELTASKRDNSEGIAVFISDV